MTQPRNPLAAAKARRAMLVRLLRTADWRKAMVLQRKIEGCAAEIRALSGGVK